ncbi:TPA: glycoside hydrolase family protein [Clostridium botulinum]|nr:glycoside hydrolase family protein [Clostridium botulinum]
MSNWKWCVQGENGKIIKGWYEDNGKWYYLNDEGIMQTSWIQDKDERWYYLKNDGSMATGWLKSPYSGKWFYLNPVSNGYKGEMYRDGTYTIDGKEYKFNTSGAWIEDTLVSTICIDFIKSWEGYFATPYIDCVGVKTLGYGMTGKEIEGLEYVTEVQATSMLKEWINKKYAPTIKKDLEFKNVNLKQHEFDALVSFAYNCGTSGLLGSTLYKNVCNGIRDKDTITSNFQAWSNGGGRRIEGLYRRRTKEAAMFSSADYTGNV